MTGKAQHKRLSSTAVQLIDLRLQVQKQVLTLNTIL